MRRLRRRAPSLAARLVRFAFAVLVSVLFLPIR